MFLKEGKTYTAIANALNEAGIPTPSGLEGGKWLTNSVISILSNEKYKGDALLQKKYTDDYLQHTLKKNEGELPQYYVENSHKGIIDKHEWEMVQVEMERRKKLGRNYSGINIFASKLICEDCGGFYGKKVWHSNDKYSREIYQCNKKFSKANGKKRCKTSHLTEKEIKTLFIKAYNQVMLNKEQLLEDTREVINLLVDTTLLDEKIASSKNEIDIISELARQMVKQNTTAVQSQEEYQKKHNDLTIRYTKIKEELDKLLSEKAYKLGQATKLEALLKELENAEQIIETWDDELWMIMVENAIVHNDKSITFKFL